MSIVSAYSFNLDLYPGRYREVIYCSAGDVGRVFSANLFYDGRVYAIPANVTDITIRGTKPDGTVFEYDVDDYDTNDNYVDFLITEQMAIVPGKVLCEIRLFAGEETIGSTNFILDVETAVYDPEAASESYIPTFETAIQEALENVADDIADIATAAAINDVKQYSDAASASATAAAGSATSAQTSAGTATTAAGSATSAAEEAEDAADRAEAAAESMSAYNTDRTPYLFRNSGGGVETGDREYDTIVGGTVVWNQQNVNPNFDSQTGWGVNACTLSVSNHVCTLTPSAMYSGVSNLQRSFVKDHVYLTAVKVYSDTQMSGRIYASSAYAPLSWSSLPTIGNWSDIATVGKAELTGTYNLLVQNNNASYAEWKVKEFVHFDLTQMFGSTIADYIYALEQATAGAGVAWFRQYFPEDYYEYNAGELLSVSGVSAHVMRDADDTIIGNYPLDDSLTLRGLPKLDGGKLYYDGDTYEADGTVTRKYGIRDYENGDATDGSSMITDGTYTVYKLTTPTTEDKDPFTNPQVVDQNGTEQYVTTSIVPVGHDTRYRVNLADKLETILAAPTTDGTYTLKVTVSNGIATYSWTST